jgi:tetratricopeptide (TPR) repeat protein
MRLDDRPVEPNASRTRRSWVRWARVVALALAAAGLLAAALIVPGWLVAITPRPVVRGTVITVLWTLFAIYVIAMPAVLIGLLRSSIVVTRARRRRDPAALKPGLRLLLLSSSCLVGLILIEVGSTIELRWSLRLPALPTRFAADASAKADADGELYLVVIGESSARGEPYHPWLSVGQLVGWQLERVFPGRKVRVDVRAEGGLCLEQAVLLLETLQRRPDAIMVFSGHNEFITRLGPTRNVRHYVEEGPLSQLALIDLARSRSSAAKLILGTLDSYYGEKTPPLDSTRAFIDHPAHSPEEYRFLCEDFAMRLDAFADYCTQIQALPIMIIPGANDGSYEPNRSVLDGSTPADARSTFEQEFQAVRAAEAGNPEASIAKYRRLARQHPEFAETHYRLARLLAAAGKWDEAKGHFVLARDLDGFIMRCPSPLREAYRTAARRHGALLVDSPRVLARFAPHGILDDYLFHDAQHLNLRGIVALANDVLAQLKERRALNWPESIPAPRVDIEECARHFDLDARKWSEICRRSASFYVRTATVRFDGSGRAQVARQYEQAALELEAGRPPLESNNPSIALAAALTGVGKSTPAPNGGDD